MRMKTTAFLIIALILSAILCGCARIVRTENVFPEEVDSLLVRREATGETALITDSEQIKELLAAINGKICLRYGDGVERSDTGKTVQYVVSIDPSGSSIDLGDDGLIFFYSETEFHYNKYHYITLAKGIDWDFAF